MIASSEAAAQPRLMTNEEFLALPDDGVERWLIRGRLYEKAPDPTTGKPMIVRNRDHSRILVRVCQVLANWLDEQPKPRGEVCGGEAGVRLQQTSESVVGIDVVYIDAEVAARRSAETTLIDGVPILAVEILSPNDTQQEINDKLDEYLDAGVKLVWIIDPRRRTVTVHRPGARPKMVNEDEELTGEPNLPGFRVAVARLFE